MQQRPQLPPKIAGKLLDNRGGARQVEHPFTDNRSTRNSSITGQQQGKRILKGLM
jgi:hypothetical protein